MREIPVAGPPEGYGLRPAREGDLPAVAALMLAFDLADFGRPDFDEDFLREEWRNPGFDPAVDAWIVGGPDGGVVGYGQVLPEEPHRVLDSFARVHPEHRGRGLGRLLLGLIEARGRKDLPLAPGGGPVRLQTWATSTDRAAAGLFRRVGFAPVRQYWHMERGLDPAPVPPPPPSGITIRPFAPGGDDRDVHRVMEEAFAQNWGIAARSFAEWAGLTVRRPGFDPRAWFVALDKDRPVGAVLARPWGERGWVDDLGVLPGWRRRGIGASLLLHTFAELARQGLPEVALNVDAENETGATALYERAGMRVRRRFDVHEKVLGPEAGTIS